MRGPVLWLSATGALTLLGQVVLLREVLVVARGSELALLLGLGTWLGWTAAGALASHWLVPSPARVRGLLLGLGLALPASVAAARAARTILAEVPGASLPFPTLLLVIALALAVAGLAGGALFGWSASLLAREGGTLARAYAVESAGALVGGLLATLLPALGVSAWHIALLAGLGAVSAALIGSRGTWRAALPVGLALAAAWTLDQPLDRLDHPHLVRLADTPYGRVAVEERAGQRAVFVDDALVHESQDLMAAELAHAAALVHPDPRRVLVLGGAVQGLGAPLSRHAAEVVQIEVDRVLAEEGGGADAVADPRRYLEAHGGWDLVLVAAAEPTSGASSRLYTREFFALTADQLTPGGLLALRLPGAENHWPSPLVRRTATVHRAMAEVFADVLLLPGESTLLLASDVPIERDPEVLTARLVAREPGARLVSKPWLRWAWTNDRVAEVDALVRAAEVEANTDLRPACYAHTLVHWLSRFHPALSTWEPPRPGWAHALGALGLLLVLGAAGRPRRPLLAGVAGAAGMVLEGAVILAYQVERGVLFQDLGLLLTGFMAGLAAGAMALDRWREPPPWGGAALSGGLILLGALTALLLRAGAVDDLPTALALLAGAGALTAALFAWSGRGAGGRPAPLYAADLVGGALGALAATLVLVPLGGLHVAALAAAALGGVGVLLARR